MLVSSFKLASLTAHVEHDLTYDYVRLVAAQSPLFTGGDAESGVHALCRELAMFMHSTLNGAKILPAPKPKNHHPECTRNHEAEEAFVDAACRADFDACTNVVKAVMKESVQRGREPAEDVIDFYGDLLMLFISACRVHSIGG